jgi:hypothetical protein
MPELLVRATLASLNESEPFKAGDDLAWLEDRNRPHDGSDA